MQGVLRRGVLVGSSAFECAMVALASAPSFGEHFWERRPFVLSLGALVVDWSVSQQVGAIVAAPSESDWHFTDAALAANNHTFATKGRLHAPSAAEMMRHLEQSTLVVNHADNHHRAIGAAAEEMERAFGIPVNGNAYLSSSSVPLTAPMHTDRMNSFVVQTEGAKRWRVFAPGSGSELPVLDAGGSERGKRGDVLYVEQVGEVLLDELLAARAGETLYLPRGFPHATSTFETSAHGAHSTSLTLSPLSESLSLTGDKLLRCLSGMAGVDAGACSVGGACAGPEQVLRATQGARALRRTLPIGFLAAALKEDLPGPDPASARCAEGAAASTCSWVGAVERHVGALADAVPGPPLLLPSAAKIRAALEHAQAALRSAMLVSRSHASQRAGGLGERRERNALLSSGDFHRRLWPEVCGIFVSPAKVEPTST